MPVFLTEQSLQLHGYTDVDHIAEHDHAAVKLASAVQRHS